ncbi:ABC-type glycerol-3-phosphate transport system permease component [Paenibacillus phyllosphaerae]|uniref:ABC-type glycerol-3-phosphate transport system permease component n=1 Tax=Paenibacillus phyllosphaerae TaxID=274593 RepID=A0A7W5FRG2_9BACL|nr:carbohydrate ABC transporter permease [Paenibacillus phyllosphaerae]MBB3113984.1 ABC-type glycerol-3-phosphate transport system permease component [Paenibacillus phyllosphaerae]
MTKRFSIASVFRHGALVLMCVLAIVPLYWMAISSLKNESEIFTSSIIPLKPTLGNYTYAFTQMPIVRMIVNSFGISIMMTMLQLTTSLLAAYALVRWRFRGKALIFSLLSVTWLIPFQAIMIPNYVLINDMGLNETWLGIVLPFCVSTFAILSLYQSFQSFPGVLIEAACIDGLSDWGILTRLILPNTRSTVASLGIIQFINAWNEYLWPMLVTKKMENAPIQIGLKLFVNSDSNMWGSLMAATTVSCLPILLIYLVLRRQIVDSFIRFGIK